MARIHVEERLENALATAIVARFVTDTVTGVSMRKFWSSDTSAAFEDISPPVVMIKIDPNGFNLDGYRTPYRQAPGLVSIITSEADDPKRVTLANIYSSVRGVLDFDTLSDTGLNPIEMTVVAGGQASVDETEKGAINSVEIPITLEVNYPGS